MKCPEPCPTTQHTHQHTLGTPSHHEPVGNPFQTQTCCAALPHLHTRATPRYRTSRLRTLKERFLAKTNWKKILTHHLFCSCVRSSWNRLLNKCMATAQTHGTLGCSLAPTRIIIYLWKTIQSTRMTALTPTLTSMCICRFRGPKAEIIVLFCESQNLQLPAYNAGHG